MKESFISPFITNCCILFLSIFITSITSKSDPFILSFIDTFAKIRELQRNVQTLSQTTDEQTKKDVIQKAGTIIN